MSEVSSTQNGRHVHNAVGRGKLLAELVEGQAESWLNEQRKMPQGSAGASLSHFADLPTKPAELRYRFLPISLSSCLPISCSPSPAPRPPSHLKS